MTYKEKYHSERRWTNKVYILDTFHIAMQHNDRNWTIRRTARAIGISLGRAAEDLKLARSFKELEIFKSRNAALKEMRNGRGSN